MNYIKTRPMLFIAVALLAALALQAVGLLYLPPETALIGFLGTTLAANQPRDYGTSYDAAYPVIASDIIYEGAAVGENASGYARPLAAADPFLGFATAKVDNSAGAAGAKNVEVRTKGVIKLAISSIAITANDRPAVYASDDNTFTLTATSNSLIGYVLQWLETGYALVEFDAALVKAALQA